MKSLVSITGLACTVLLILTCATPPERRETPPWIDDARPAAADGVALVAYGSGDNADEAGTAAREDLVVQLTRVLLDHYDGEARGVSDETARSIEQVAARRGESLLPDDRHEVFRPDGIHETYLYFHYNELQLEEDIALLPAAPAAARRPTPPLRDPAPEEEPPPEEDLFSEMQRLLASVPPDRDGASDTLRQVLARASRVVFSSAPGEIQHPLGTTLQRELAVRVAGYENLRLAVLEIGPEIDGNRTVARDTLRTGLNGIGRYTPRNPEVSGLARVRFQPEWLEAAIEAWSSVHDDPRIRADLDVLADRLSATSAIRVTSAAPTIPTAVILIDRDIAGNPIGARDSARGAFQQFQEQGFRVVATDLSSAVESSLAALENPTVADMYDILPFDLLTTVERVVVGTAGIAQFTETEGVTVVLDVRVHAFDLRRDRRLAGIEMEERATGRDPRATLRSAFHSAGRRAARQIAPRLP